MGFTTLSVPQITDAVRGFYGTVDQMALNKMEDILASPLDQVSNLDKHLANMRQHMLMQTTAGYPIEEHRKVRIFRKSVLSHHLIAGILADYDHDNIDPLTQTYDIITAYVKKHLPNLRAAADLASSAGQALSVTPCAPAAPGVNRTAGEMGHAELLCAFAVLEHKHKNAQQQLKRAGQRGKNKGEERGAKKAKNTNPPLVPVTAEECTSYCHAHGYQSSHTSAQCKVMANQKQNFTAEMRKATSPNSPPGGSKLVRGREPPVTGQANMMTSFGGHEAEGSSSAEPDNGGGESRNRPVSAFPPPNGNRGSDDAGDMRLYAIAFAAHRPQPGESNAESAERSRRIDAHVEALKLEGGVLSQTGYLPQANTGFWDNDYVKGKRSPSPPASPVPVGLPPPNPAPANQSETTDSRCVAFLIREESQTASVALRPCC
jgi:hypothetical protein